MATEEQFKFVQALAKDLDAGDVRLPSLPAVILKIRDLLEDENADFENVSKIVSVDSALVSRLFVFANSAYHNRTGEKIVSLETAIAKLGLELVRSTAVALVVKQLVFAQEQSHILKFVKGIWTRSMRLSSMAHALAGQHKALNDETAFMCGLLHDIGKLYVLSKAKETPDFLKNTEWFNHVLGDWSQQIGRAIVEGWDFPPEVVESMEPNEFLDKHVQRAPKMVDVVYAAGLLLDNSDTDLEEILAMPTMQKLKINKESIPAIFAAYKEKLATVHQSLA